MPYHVYMSASRKFLTTLEMASAFWQFPLRKKDREKTGFACELDFYQWKRMPFGWCNATATLQRIMAQHLSSITMKYGNLMMCNVDDIRLARPFLIHHVGRIDEVLDCIRKAGSKCKTSKCEIHMDSIKYVRRMVDKHEVMSNPEAVEAV